MPPISVTAALIFAKTGAQLGEVHGYTKISPDCTLLISSGVKHTHASPSTTPGEAGKLSSSGLISAASNQPLTLSVVIPHNTILDGSVTMSGGDPSAGGGVYLRSASIILLRLSIIEG